MPLSPIYSHLTSAPPFSRFAIALLPAISPSESCLNPKLLPYLPNMHSIELRLAPVGFNLQYASRGREDLTPVEFTNARSIDSSNLCAKRPLGELPEVELGCGGCKTVSQ